MCGTTHSDQQAKKNSAIPAGIAGIQMVWMANTSHLYVLGIGKRPQVPTCLPHFHYPLQPSLPIRRLLQNDANLFKLAKRYYLYDVRADFK